MAFPNITVEVSIHSNHQRPVHQTNQEIDYGLVDDQLSRLLRRLNWRYLKNTVMVMILRIYI